ncbi:MAG: hypothetical protein QXT40_01465 [Candidatus Micrarchaeia archaeon]
MHDPLLDFIVRKEKNIERTAEALFEEDTVKKIEKVLDEEPVRIGIEKLLSHFEQNGGALPSHNFAHAIDVCVFALGIAIENKVEDKEALIDLALASLFHDSVRYYKDEDDTAIKEIKGETSSENIESIEDSIELVGKLLNNVRNSKNIKEIQKMIKEASHPIGKYLHMADCIDLGEPLRNSSIAIEHKTARKAGWWWVAWKYKKVYKEKTNALPPLEQTHIEVYSMKLGGTGISRGLQTLLAEGRGLIEKAKGFIPVGLKPHELRKESLEGREILTKKRLVSLAWQYRKTDKSFSKRIFQYAKDPKRIEKQIKI